MTVAFALLLALLPSSATAQEDEFAAGRAKAIQDGFAIVVPSDEATLPAFAAHADRTLIQPFMQILIGDRSYTFSLLQIDYNGDGRDDVVTCVRTGMRVTDGLGGPVVYATAQGTGWSEPTLDEAGALAVRKRSNGDGSEVALVDKDSYRIIR